METEQQNDQEFEEQEQAESGAVEIYSKNTIFAFCIFPDVLFGAALLMINLFKVGLKRAAWGVLAFAIAFTFFGGTLAAVLVNVGLPFIVTGILIKVIGGIILSNYFFPKYFPDNDYYPRSIWGALIVSLVVWFGLLLLAAPYMEQMLKQLKQQ